MARAKDLATAHFAEIGFASTKEGTVLEFVANNPTASQKEIADETGTNPSILVSVLDDLTARGLLVRERSTVDRRRYHVRLTEAGEGLRERIRKCHFAGNEEMLAEAGFSSEEAQTLVTLLDKLVTRPSQKRS